MLPQPSVLAEGARLLRGAFQLDQSTSITDLGSLFVPTGDHPVQRLKRNLAQAYGMAWSFPSTHGTTMLNILALLTACPAGGRVLVNRDAHSSVTAALIHGGFEPIYLVPSYDRDLGISLGPTLADVEQVLDSSGHLDCVFLTSPNYFGVVGQLGAVIAAAHRRGLPVVVDAAHAPHFHFSDALPTGAEDLGADFVTQSTHKVATALSQGSLLLLRSEAQIEPLYEQVNDLGLVSTSFSYPILASLEIGVAQLEANGDQLWRQALSRADGLAAACRELPGVAVLGSGHATRPGFTDIDRTRVTLDLAKTGLTGFEVERSLNARHVYPEMATHRHVLFLITPGTTDEDVYAVFEALRAIVEEASGRPALVTLAPPAMPVRVMLPREAKFARKQRISVGQAVGRVAGETIATYPPGVPIIMAGEVFTPGIVDYLRAMHRCGAVLKGASDPDFLTVKVL
jgi:arginine/lysine/ornithine decarboxylase